MAVKRASTSKKAVVGKDRVPYIKGNNIVMKDVSPKPKVKTKTKKF